MAKFWKIKKRSYWQTAIELKKYLPYLKSIPVEDIESDLRGSGLFIVKEELAKKPFLIRLTLPFGFAFLLLLLISMPLKFIVTGKWGYQWKWLSNWFSALGF